MGDVWKCVCAGAGKGEGAWRMAAVGNGEGFNSEPLLEMVTGFSDGKQWIKSEVWFCDKHYSNAGGRPLGTIAGTDVIGGFIYPSEIAPVRSETIGNMTAKKVGYRGSQTD